MQYTYVKVRIHIATRTYILYQYHCAFLVRFHISSSDYLIYWKPFSQGVFVDLW